MSRGTLDPAAAYCFHVRGFHPLRPAFPGRSANRSAHMMQSITPVCTHTGLGSSSFARRYFRNRCFFLFLRLLRCFSSPGSLPYVMDWRMDDRGILCQVSPFRNLRINGYVLLPEAYRSLSRLSSALSAKASALCSFCLTSLPPACSVRHGCFFVASLFLLSQVRCLPISLRLTFLNQGLSFMYAVFKVQS